MMPLPAILSANEKAERDAHVAIVNRLHDEATGLLCRDSDLNTILGRVIWTLETEGDESDIKFAEAAIRVVKQIQKGKSK